MTECAACHKEAITLVTIRKSNTDKTSYPACQKPFNIARNKMMVFLKHVKRKFKKGAHPCQT